MKFKPNFGFRKDGGSDGALKALQKNGVPELLVSSVRRIMDSTRLITDAKRSLKVTFFPHLAVSKVKYLSIVCGSTKFYWV